MARELTVWQGSLPMKHLSENKKTDTLFQTKLLCHNNTNGRASTGLPAKSREKGETVSSKKLGKKARKISEISEKTRKI